MTGLSALMGGSRGLGGGHDGGGSIVAAVQFLRRAATMEVAQQYDIVRANHRLSSALSGQYSFADDTSSRTLGEQMFAAHACEMRVLCVTRCMFSPLGCVVHVM